MIKENPIQLSLEISKYIDRSNKTFYTFQKNVKRIAKKGFKSIKYNNKIKKYLNLSITIKKFHKRKRLLERIQNKGL
jgi:hypothetical protein